MPRIVHDKEHGVHVLSSREKKRHNETTTTVRMPTFALFALLPISWDARVFPLQQQVTSLPTS